MSKRRDSDLDHGFERPLSVLLGNDKTGTPYAEARKWRRRFFFLCFFNIAIGIACLGKLRGWW